MAKGEVGIRERKRIPTLKEFAPRFEQSIGTLCAEKPATISFYAEKLGRLLEYAPFATSPLDAIDEAMVDAIQATPFYTDVSL